LRELTEEEQALKAKFMEFGYHQSNARTLAKLCLDIRKENLGFRLEDIVEKSHSEAKNVIEATAKILEGLKRVREQFSLDEMAYEWLEDFFKENLLRALVKDFFEAIAANMSYRWKSAFAENG